MKEFETMKMYGKILRKWTHMETVNWKGEEREVERTSQYEIGYTEYAGTGEKVGAGTEDFSAERFQNLKYYRVFTWDGQKYNKGGYRWFEEKLVVKIERRNRKLLKELAAKWFPAAAEISIR